jgi:hypothetical protein
MRREISSSITNLYKVLFLLVPVIIIALNLYNTLIDSSSRQIFLTSGSMLFGFFIMRWALNWKKVELTDNGIFISSANFFNDKEIFVPFDQIEVAWQDFWLRGNPEFVSIKLSALTSFGNKIWFIPKSRFFPNVEHPVVKELNRLASQNRGFIT